MTRLALPLAALLTLAACSGYEEDEPVDPMSASEREALDDAAEMIEQRRLPEEALAPENDRAGDDQTEETAE